MADLLVVDIAEDDLVTVSFQREGDRAPDVAGSPVRWVPPLDAQALEDLRWYLEDYLRMPFGVYEQRGPTIAAQLLPPTSAWTPLRTCGTRSPEPLSLPPSATLSKAPTPPTPPQEEPPHDR